MALLALTAGEVILFEIWHRTEFVPKFVMVMMILVLTLPKAAIVMIYFMHLKFEKHFLVLIAVIPLIMVFVAILPTLTDIMTLRANHFTDNKAHGLGDWELDHSAHHSEAHEDGAAHGEGSHEEHSKEEAHGE